MNKKENLLRKANEMKQRGKLKEAIPEYRRAIEQAPNCSWSHFFLGEALAESGDWVNAVSSLRQAAKLNSTSKVIQEKLNFGLTNLEKNAKKEEICQIIWRMLQLKENLYWEWMGCNVLNNSSSAITNNRSYLNNPVMPSQEALSLRSKLITKY